MDFLLLLRHPQVINCVFICISSFLDLVFSQIPADSILNSALAKCSIRETFSFPVEVHSYIECLCAESFAVDGAVSLQEAYIPSSCTLVLHRPPLCIGAA